MATKHRQHHDEEQDPAPSRPVEQPEGEVQPGCSEPGTTAPSVVGTSQDPHRKKED